MWLYPLGVTLSQPLLRRAWESQNPLAVVGFQFRDEAEAMLLQHSAETVRLGAVTTVTVLVLCSAKSA